MRMMYQTQTSCPLCRKEIDWDVDELIAKRVERRGLGIGIVTHTSCAIQERINALIRVGPQDAAWLEKHIAQITREYSHHD